MAILESGRQPRVARAFIQVGLISMRCVSLAGVVCAGACSNYHTTGPEAWWHDAIGGKIAQDRPAPPGAKDPFPKLSTVPPKPAPTDVAAWNRMTAGLLTDRINAREAAALAPIPPPASGSPTAAPASSGRPNPDQGASAALVGASSPQPAAAKAPPAPKPAAQPAPAIAQPAPAVAQPAPKAAPAVASKKSPAPALGLVPVQPTPFVSSAVAAQRVANGALPALPTSEPPRPNIAPGPPPRAIPVTAAPPMAPESAGTGIDFSRGSAALNVSALADVKAVAAERGVHGIAVTGHGDAASSDAIGQSEALDLALRRAQAVATALVAQGVPYAFLRVNAEAAGRGANLRLLQ